MRKKNAVMLVILLLLQPMLGLGEMYAFPYVGVRVVSQVGWTLLTPDTLDAMEDFLAQTGADAEALRADYAAQGTAFEVFLPGGVQVSLSTVETEQTVTWGDMERMTQADIDMFLLSYRHAPYENVHWSPDAPGYLSYRWSLEAGGVEVSFARLSTVRQGALYTLTATGVNAEVWALDAANLEVMGSLSFVGNRIAAGEETETAADVPGPIEEDGRVTPVSFVEFTGITNTDMTTITIQTLPGAELALQTANDILRGRANGDGMHRYEVSTRRMDATYTYTLTATAEGRETSTVPLSITRRPSAEELEAAYRQSAQLLEALGYSRICASLETFENQAVTFRGKASAFGEMGGFPCVLVYTSCTEAGVWENPLWVMLTKAVMVADGEMVTVYGDIRGDTLPYAHEETLSVPVVIGRSLIK